MGDSDDLPCEFDVIIVGTGMVESIVAAASARVGKKVLHLDSNSYYGQFWATVSFDTINELANKYIESNKEPVIDPSRLPSQEQTLCFTRSEISSIESLIYQWSSYGNCNISGNKAESEDQSSSSVSFEDVNSEFAESKNTTNTSEDDSLNSTQSENKIEPEVEVPVLKENDNSKNNWSHEKIRESYRKFNLDFAPKVLFSTGPMVNLLLQSCVSRYTQFLNISEILTYRENKIEKVPCSKSDVFSSKNVSIVDKRILMKVLNNCLSMSSASEEFEAHSSKTFYEYLKGEKVPEHLIHYILYSIAVATKQTSFSDGVLIVQQFLKNIGRYGNSPFLWPLFGSGELLQAFCRLSAVFGGIYYLTRGAEAIVLDEPTHCCGVISNSKLLKSNDVVLSVYSCPLQFISPSESGIISRATLITDKSLFPKEKEGVLLLNYPPTSNELENSITVIELPPSSGVCPPGLYVVHISFTTSVNCHSIMTEVIDNLFVRGENIVLNDVTYDKLLDKLSDSHLKNWIHSAKDVSNENVDYKPKILYSLMYSLKDSKSFLVKEDKPSNLHICQGPSTNIDFESAVREAENIFRRMYPNEDFLQPVPDPNEVTIDGTIENEIQEGESVQEEVSNNDELAQGVSNNDEVIQDLSNNDELTQELSVILNQVNEE